MQIPTMPVGHTLVELLTNSDGNGILSVVMRTSGECAEARCSGIGNAPHAEPTGLEQLEGEPGKRMTHPNQD